MDARPLDAGDFEAWLDGMLAAIAGTRDADVPCGSCTACCESSQFVLVEPTDTGALAAIPSDLLVPAPGLPSGYRVMGYDERGRCPMLGDDGCSIYADRPRTCRTYDCRVFPATGVAVEIGKPRISERAARWRFGGEGGESAAANPEGDARRRAVEAAAAFLAVHPELWPVEVGPPPPTQLAVIALEVHGAFLADEPSVAEVQAVLAARRSRL